MARAKRLEFNLSTKLEACIRRMVCPGLPEIHRACGKPLIDGVQFDHIKRCEIEPDNSVENCRPICPECHAIKTARDAAEAAKGRKIRKETKKSQKPKAKIRSSNTLTKEHRQKMRDWKAEQDSKK